ncbi:MAG: Nif11-like leader peptide family natural product precursor [Clostridiales bacterium]|jgi:predicted ribosomally synthesized peptide with nif11-like leader|nr:Nif11-like leader peptide family natural product precursor [Clostridiales bacterium]
MNITAFTERIIRDKEFASKFYHVNSPEQLLNIARREGYRFTLDDMRNDAEFMNTEIGSIAADEASTSPLLSLVSAFSLSRPM